MTKRLISFLIALCIFIAIPLSARYKYNPFTRKLDYYETGADIDLGDLADVTLTGLATGNVLYYDGSAWVNLATGANTQFLTLAAGIPAWQAIPAGVTTFVGLTDTPNNYAGSNSYMVRVNAGASALVFGAESAIDHDGLTNWAANKHVVLPGTIANVLSDHTLLVHTTLGLFDASSDVDHNLTTNYAADQHVVLPGTIANVLSDHTLLVHTTLGLFDQSSDVDHNQTTNYDANRHVDHTAVSILSGGLITGGGTIDGNQTLTLTEATIEGAIDTLGAIQFTGDVEFLEDITVTWVDAADHATITQSNNVGIENQALIYILDEREGATVDEAIEATLRINADGPTYAFYIEDGDALFNNIAYFSGDTYQYEDVFISWGDAADHMTIIQGNAAGIEAQALIYVQDDRIGTTANEPDEASLHIANEGPDSWAIYADIGKVQWDGDVLWSWASAADHAVITQSNNAGIEDQPLIYIDDNRVGTTVNEDGEASLVINGPNGLTGFYMARGYLVTSAASRAYFGGRVYFKQGDNYVFDNKDFSWGSAGFHKVMWDTNAAGDSLLTHRTVQNAAYTAAIFYSNSGLTANGMTDHDDYLSPTFVLTNDEGADANDYSGVVIGERTQASVLVAHYFDFYAMTGAADGSADPNATELAAIFRFGASGTGTPTYATTPGDVLFEGAIEVNGQAYFDADTNQYEDVFITWDDALDKMVIAQSAIAGTEDQPLIAINDSRTGATVDEAGEASLVIDAEGAYALNVIDGKVQIGSTSAIESFASYTQYDNKSMYFGSTLDSHLMWDTNGTGDDLFIITTSYGATSDNTAAIFVADTLAPNNMTDHNDYTAPTFIVTNSGGADANDYAGVVIGERTQDDVKVAHYFDFYAMTGAVDGSVDVGDELAAIFRFGPNGTGVPDNATTPGDILSEGNLEVDGTIYADGGIVHVVSKEVNFDDGSPVAIATVADGYMITCVIVEITTTWDGNGTIVVGDGNDPDGYLEDANITQGAAAYYGWHHDERGTYLWDSAGGGTGHDDCVIYTGADTVDATLVAGTSTQGVATVYVHLIRLK